MVRRNRNGTAHERGITNLRCTASKISGTTTESVDTRVRNTIRDSRIAISVINIHIRDDRVVDVAMVEEPARSPAPVSRATP
jgi:hypothetical protein